MTARRVVMLVAIFALGLAVQAQAHGKKGRMKHHGGDRIKAALELSEDQLAQLDVLKTQHQEQKQAMRDEHKQAFEALLDDGQQAILEEHRASRAAEGQDRRCKRPDLGLSEEQKEAAAVLREGHKAVRRALREEFKAAFEGMLNDRQLEILEEIRANRPHRKDRTDEASGDADASGDTATTAALRIDLADDGAPTAVEDVNWGRIKEQMGQ